MSHERFTPIPEVYADTLERIDARIAEYDTLGIETHEERINRAFHRSEVCGCMACKRRFWHAVEEAVVAEFRHDEQDIIEAIEKYTPLIDEVADLDDDDLGDD
jgi:hypothetical protein